MTPCSLVETRGVKDSTLRVRHSKDLRSHGNILTVRERKPYRTNILSLLTCCLYDGEIETYKNW